MNVPMQDDLREAVVKLRRALSARSDASAVRLAIQMACRKHGVPVPEDVEGAPPGTYDRSKVAKKGGKKTARKPR